MPSVQGATRLHSTGHTWRNILSWVLLGLAVTESFALWMVCSQQMREADMRRVELQVQQMAMADCLQYISGSTIASCAAPVDSPAARKATVRTPSDHPPVKRSAGPLLSAVRVSDR